jgi:hypothetical protein
LDDVVICGLLDLTRRNCVTEVLQWWRYCDVTVTRGRQTNVRDVKQMLEDMRYVRDKYKLCKIIVK